MPETRKAIHAWLSPEAHDGWHDFAAEEGVSVSGLLEAIAADWAEREKRGEPPATERDRVTKAARRVDAARRRRSPD